MGAHGKYAITMLKHESIALFSWSEKGSQRFNRGEGEEREEREERERREMKERREWRERIG